MKKLTQAITFIVILSSTTVFAAEGTIHKCENGQRISCVVDGDTIWFKGEKIRLMGYDTPEPTTNICGGQKETRLAALASNRLVELLNENQFTIERHGKDRYGRTLAVVKIEGRDVGDILIAEGLARSWPDGNEFWCE